MSADHGQKMLHHNKIIKMTGVYMNFTYKTATLEDIDILVTTRIEVLRAANKLDDQTDMSEVTVQSRDY